MLFAGLILPKPSKLVFFLPSHQGEHLRDPKGNYQDFSSTADLFPQNNLLAEVTDLPQLSHTLGFSREPMRRAGMDGPSCPCHQVAGEEEQSRSNRSLSLCGGQESLGSRGKRLSCCLEDRAYHWKGPQCPSLPQEHQAKVEKFAHWIPRGKAQDTIPAARAQKHGKGEWQIVKIRG